MNNLPNNRRQFTRSKLDRLAIKQLSEEYRLGDLPGGDVLVAHVLMNPSSAGALSLWKRKLNEQALRRQLANDPFWQNYPNGELSRSDGPIRLIELPTGQAICLGAQHLCMNLIATGPPGSGKTTLLRNVLRSGVMDEISFVCFDSKDNFEDLLDCQSLAQLGNVLELQAHDLKIAVPQWPAGLTKEQGIGKIVEEITANFSLFASGRLLLETLHEAVRLFEKPTLLQWMELLRSLNPKSNLGRLHGYKEASLMALSELLYNFGEAVCYSESDLFERISSWPGIVVIRTGRLNERCQSWLFSRLFGWEFARRGIAASRDGTSAVATPRIFVADDALRIVRGGWNEAEQGINPVSQWALLGRSRQLGLLIASHSFSAISPVLRGNADTVVCCAALGRDVQAIAEHMQLTREQAAVLPTLQPGTAVVFSRSVWPKAVMGRFEPVP